MEIQIPDPHPGRCQNTRLHRGPYGATRTLRCLDYDGTQHVCSFPEVPKETGKDWGAYSIPKPKPKAWVKPPATDG